MDLREFYSKIREIEKTINDVFAVVISLKTSDGGKPGVPAEVTRAQAARLVAENRARLASETEAAEYRGLLAEQARQAEEERIAQRLQLTVISESDLRELRGTPAKSSGPAKKG